MKTWTFFTDLEHSNVVTLAQQPRHVLFTRLSASQRHRVILPVIAEHNQNKSRTKTEQKTEHKIEHHKKKTEHSGKKQNNS